MDEWLKLLLTAAGSVGISQMVTFFVGRRDKQRADQVAEGKQREAERKTIDAERTQAQKAQDELGASVANMLRAELKQQFDGMSNRIKQLEADNTGARRDFQELSDSTGKRIKALENENYLLHDESELLRKGQRELTEKNASAVREIARLNDELVKRDVQVGVMTGQISVLNNLVSERDTTIYALRGRVAELEDKVKNLQGAQ